MSKQNFDKFINKKVTGAKKKEKFKQEKKLAKKEREAYFIEKKREVRAAKKLHQEAPPAPKADSKNTRNKYPKDTNKPEYGKGKPATDKKFEGKKFEGKKFEGKKTTDRPYSSDKEKKPFKDKKEPKTYTKDKGKPVRREKPEVEKTEERLTKATSSYKENKAAFEKRATQKNKGEPFIEEKRPAKKSPANNTERPARQAPPESTAPKKKLAPREENKPANKEGRKSFEKKGEWKPNDPGLPYARKVVVKPISDDVVKKPAAKPKKPVIDRNTGEAVAEEMPLNKFIAHGGVCSRRDAGELVKSGKVKVNGVVITEPGYKVQETDEVYASGKKVTNKHNLVYILLNKPKDFITTAEDPQGRKTVLDIVKGATDERIYPVGRLDRNTSGVLLLTNDGELAQQLTHPSYEVRKIYEAKLDKPLTKDHFDKLLDGVTLEDGLVKADSVAYADSKDRSVIGIEIHSGRNRVVRRMFESLGYDVKGLDRVMFATLTKKNVDRGTWRFLEEKEVRLLKFFNKSKK